jgi:hypothetical protein
MTKQQLLEAIIPALIATAKSTPSPENAKKILDEALAWSEAMEAAKNADRKYQVFFVG